MTSIPAVNHSEKNIYNSKHCKDKNKNNLPLVRQILMIRPRVSATVCKKGTTVNGV